MLVTVRAGEHGRSHDRRYAGCDGGSGRERARRRENVRIRRRRQEGPRRGRPGRALRRAGRRSRPLGLRQIDAAPPARRTRPPRLRLDRVGGTRVDLETEQGLTRLRRADVGFVFQSFHLLPELTGLENVLLPARLAGDGRVAARNARALISRLGLDEAASRLPTSLSGGEQQRLAIVRALVNDPVLLLADEPTGNLDTESGLSVLQLLREVADGGRGVVLVTHDREAAAIADRVLTLRDGRLQ